MRSRSLALVVALFLLLGSQPALGQVPPGSAEQEGFAGEATGPPPADDSPQSPPDASGGPESGAPEAPEAPSETVSAPADAQYAPPKSQPEPAPSEAAASELGASEPAPSEPAAPEPSAPEPSAGEAASSEPALAPEPSPESGVAPEEAAATPTTADGQYAGEDSSPAEGVVAPSYASGCGDGPQCPEPAFGEDPRPSDETPVEDTCGPSGCEESGDPFAADPACEQYGCEQYGGVADPNDAPPQYGGDAPLLPDDGSGFGDGGGSGLPPGQAPLGEEPSAEQPTTDYPIPGYPYEGAPCGEDNCGAPLDDPTLECATFTTASGQPVVGCSSPDYYAGEGCVFVDFYDGNGDAYGYVESCDGAPVEPPEPPVRPPSVPDNYECGVVSGTSLGDVQLCYDPAEAAAGVDCPEVELYDAQGNFLGTTEDCADGGGLFYKCGPDNCGAQEVPPGYACQKVGPNPLWGDPADGSTKIYCSPAVGALDEYTPDGSCFDLVYDEQGTLLEKIPCDPQTQGGGEQAAENHEDAVAALDPGTGAKGAENKPVPTFSGGEDSAEVEGAGRPGPEAEELRPETEERPPTGAEAGAPEVLPLEAEGSGSPETPIALSAPRGGDAYAAPSNGAAPSADRGTYEGGPLGDRGPSGVANPSDGGLSGGRSVSGGGTYGGGAYGGNAYFGSYGSLLGVPAAQGAQAPPWMPLAVPSGRELSAVGAASTRGFDLGGVEVAGDASRSGAGLARGSSTAEEAPTEGRVPRAPSATPVAAGSGATEAGATEAGADPTAWRRVGDEEEAEGNPRPVAPADGARRAAAAGPLEAPPAAGAVGGAEQRSGFSPWLLAGASGAVAVVAAVGSRRLFGAYLSRRR